MSLMRIGLCSIFRGVAKVHRSVAQLVICFTWSGHVSPAQLSLSPFSNHFPI